VSHAPALAGATPPKKGQGREIPLTLDH